MVVQIPTRKELRKKSKEELIRVIFSLKVSLSTLSNMNNKKSFIIRNNKKRLDKIIRELQYIQETPETHGVNPENKKYK